VVIICRDCATLLDQTSVVLLTYWMSRARNHSYIKFENWVVYSQRNVFARVEWIYHHFKKRIDLMENSHQLIKSWVSLKLMKDGESCRSNSTESREFTPYSALEKYHQHRCTSYAVIIIIHISIINGSRTSLVFLFWFLTTSKISLGIELGGFYCEYIGAITFVTLLYSWVIWVSYSLPAT
jgi:hypothetical protein